MQNSLDFLRTEGKTFIIATPCFIPVIVNEGTTVANYTIMNQFLEVCTCKCLLDIRSGFCFI